MGARQRASSAIGFITLTLFGVSLAVTFPKPPRAPEPRRVPELWAMGDPADTLSRGAALSHILASKGLDDTQIREITRLLRTYKSPRSLRPGAAVRFYPRGGGIPNKIRLDITPDSALRFVRVDSAWTAHVELVPFTMDTVVVSGLIESSLWAAHLGGDVDRLGDRGFEDLVYDLADVFAWKVDFTRDLRKGDSFRLALERKIRPDGTIRSRHFLAIELTNGGHVLRAIPRPRAGGRYAYYDEEGRSLHGAFLRYPVPYRVTSRFTSRRYHPILKRYRAHEGIDYGAPTGTPVEATASGVVTRAGWAGGYGRLVELRHAQGIRTRYAHLSAIGAGIRPGAPVTQGMIIGRVGASGLATGPHLHYEFLKNGHHQNPLTVELPGQPSLATSQMDAFRRERDHALALIEGVPLPDEIRFAAAQHDRGRKNSRP
jgi:murein DD-endopeptidase MepM/ murein hydrolase activator NlpD